jgi:hypothetical protein
MDHVIVSWNGQNINNGTPFKASFPLGSKTRLNANPIFVQRAGEYPKLSGAQLGSHTLNINVWIADGQNINTNRELVKQYFNTDGLLHNLIITDGSGGTQWYVSGIVQSVNPDGQAMRNGFVITIAVEYPYFRLVTAATDTWNITASGQGNGGETNAGNIKVPPKFDITPTIAKVGGYLYRRWVAVYNNLDAGYVDAIDITGGGLDTATLTTAKMQADGDDFRVWMDGAEADRWLYDMDTAATKCWVNLSFSPKQEGTISGNLAGAGSTATVSFSRTRANLAFLQFLKTKAVNRVLLIESEALTFTAANVDTFNYQITGAVRAAKGTTIAAHVAPLTIRWIEHDIWILYGDSSASAPDTNDDYKPIFSLASTNASRVYTNFFDTGSARPGAWKGGVQSSRTQLSYTYTGDENVFTNPSVELGLAMVGGNDFQVANEQGTLYWIYTDPAGITSVTYAGKKYNTSSWPAIVGLQYLQDNAVWFTANNETEPIAEYTWQAIPSTAVALGGTYKTIRFVIDGQLDSVIGEAVLAQFDALTLARASANLPTISVGSEIAAYYFDTVLANTTTSESLRFAAVCGLNDTLTIDCENKLCYLSDGGQVKIPEKSTNREAWLDMAVGSNVLTFTDAGTAGVTVITTHRDRTL